MTEELYIPEWFNQTTLHPLGIAAVLVLGMAMLLVPRRYAVLPMLIMACFVSPAQRVVVLTLDFNLLRIMVLFGWMRLLLRHELNGVRWKSIDTVVVLWSMVTLVVPTLYSGSFDTFIYRTGVVFDALGMYLLFRFLVRDWRDVASAARAAAVVSLPVAIAFLVEKGTGRNMFHIFGGVPEVTIVRAGRLRCQGAFAHPILAGTFWAAAVPLMASLWWARDRHRYLAPLGVSAALAIIITCTSSTPICALGIGLGAACLFPFRHYLWWARAAAVVGLIAIQLVMVNPIWHLIARIDFVGGSMGWYRFKLIDEFVRHFDQWWLAGTDQYATWWVWGLEDLTNQYVSEGVTGGLLGLGLFVAVIVLAFRGVGRAERLVPRRTVPAALGWGLGISLLIHCVAFIGVTYFGQIIMLWYLTLAMIGTIAPSRAMWQRVLRSHRLAVPLPRRDSRSAPPAGPVPGWVIGPG